MDYIVKDYFLKSRNKKKLQGFVPKVCETPLAEIVEVYDKHCSGCIICALY